MEEIIRTYRIFFGHVLGDDTSVHKLVDVYKAVRYNKRDMAARVAIYCVKENVR